ncbi:RagB/SusD family nutrient uptake outer membrane protein [Spirosoma telluris]|uniref:RagB/SusD family nutrient uptake outer membrane protein n=1 Tax=Spirosoma telluris TaxID=2183553 RepID=UPI002FC35865
MAGVQRCNTLLAGIEAFSAKANAADAASANLIKGQTLYLRAWYYFYLTSQWGESFIVDGQGAIKWAFRLSPKRLVASPKHRWHGLQSNSAGISLSRI